MKTIFVSATQYAGIRTGVASAILVDESDDYHTNDKVIIKCNEVPCNDLAFPSVICSINVLVTHSGEPLLKKNVVILFLSVVSILADEQLVIL